MGRAPGPAAVLGKARRENFPVASIVLPRAVRGDLMAIYGFARLVDDLGDEAEGDRLSALEWLEGDLEAAYAGTPTHPLMRRLVPAIRDRRLPPEPFRMLIEANRQDQRVSRYERFGDLLRYCELSANPVGHLVLHVLDLASPERKRLSDSICTGLQLVEHWQDVAEDYERGRVYLPLEDLRSFGVPEQDLGASTPSAAFRRLMAFEVARARELLDAGAPLAATMPGRAAFAVAGFVAGGRSALTAIERDDYDVLGGNPRPSRVRRAAALISALAAAARGRRR